MAITDHIPYSAADIQLYLEGKMPPAEMHALEKAALDDPFLADAIEGIQQTLEQHDASVVHTHLQELGKQVQERAAKKEETRRVVAFRWWQVAVAAAIIVVAGIGIFRNNSDEAKEQRIVKMEEVRPTPADLQRTVAADSVVNSNSVPTADSAIQNNFSTADRFTATQEAANQATPTIKAFKEPNVTILPKKPVTPPLANVKHASEAKADAEGDVAIVASEKKKEIQAPNNMEDRKKDSAVVVGYGTKKYQDIAISNTARQQPLEQIVIPRSRRDSLAKGYYTKPRNAVAMYDETKDMSERQLKRAVDKNPDVLLSGYIKGRVADQFNNPLYNAVVRTTDNDRDFLTDKQGYFKIPLPARDSTVKIAVGFNGYYTQNLRVYNYSDNNITLNQLGLKPPNPALNTTIKRDTLTFDVKSRSYSEGKEFFGATDKAKSSIQDVLQPNTQPEYGWLEYHQYLDKNKRIPQDDPLTGNVVVSFLVDKRGRLSDFKVDESLRKDYDDEAIRLVKAGPAWKLVNGSKPSRATVIVHF